MRFVVQDHGNAYTDKYYSIKDIDAERWNMPERAVSLFFSSRVTAQEIANILNKEWASFIKNPY